jgi:hypothetical protein
MKVNFEGDHHINHFQVPIMFALCLEQMFPIQEVLVGTLPLVGLLFYCLAFFETL